MQPGGRQGASGRDETPGWSRDGHEDCFEVRVGFSDETLIDLTDTALDQDGSSPRRIKLGWLHTKKTINTGR
jgi:hypothetical protein